MMDESQTVRAIAQASEKIADLATRAGGFISKVVGGPSSEIAGVAQDWARFYRYKNLIQIADRVDAILRHRQLEGKTTTIPLRLALPMLEAAGLEDDGTLQDIWARLIVNSIDPSFKQPLHPSFIEIVRQLSPDEAIILSRFRKVSEYPFLFSFESPYRTTESGFSVAIEQPTYAELHDKYSRWCGGVPLKNRENAEIYLDNLQRVQLVEFGFDLSTERRTAMDFPRFSAGHSEPISALTRLEYLRMTIYGERFVGLCIRDRGDEHSGM
jgi:hypothetical protein